MKLHITNSLNYHEELNERLSSNTSIREKVRTLYAMGVDTANGVDTAMVAMVNDTAMGVDALLISFHGSLLYLKTFLVLG